MRFSVLGPLAVVDDLGVRVSVGGSKRRDLLLRLLIDANRVVPTAMLIEDLWRGDPPPGAEATLQSHVSHLRKPLGASRLVGDSGGYRLVAERRELVAAVFEGQLGQGRRLLESGHAAGAERVLAEALAQWHGSALSEVADAEWAQHEAARLEDLRLLATELLLDAQLALGRHGEVSSRAEMMVALHPLRERLWAQLITALYRDGRQADSLRAYGRLRSLLVEELGIEPSAELRQLERHILAQDPTIDAHPRRSVAAGVRPSGTVTFLFTDIEGSTSRWQADEGAMSAALAEHDDTIRTAVERHDGVVFKHTGDGVCAVFTSARSAIDAAIEIQGEISLPVRIGLHTGEAVPRGDDYFGPALNRTARVMDAGHGGQILVSAATAALSPAHPFVDHGRFRLRGLPEPEHVLQVGHDRFPALRAVREIVGNLPTELTSFVGRTVEMSAVADTLVDHRLVTLIGVGGAGKTRLAVETARQMAPMYPNGCWIVELAPVAAPEAVPFAFAAGLDIALARQEEVIDVIVAHLRDRRMVVVVDNCEHLLAAAANVVARIAAECPSVAILSTSREPLMLSGERLVTVAPLAPDEATKLFRERARAEIPDLTLDDAQSSAVATLCMRLDGLPLAVELAASRIRAFTPVELLSLLDERFRLLVGGRRSRMERHQTMRGTLDWSYELCGGTERAVFDRLSVFAATFDLGDARAVTSGDDVSGLDVTDTVPTLVDRSLLQRTVASDGTTRYRMLETMRAYGREHLEQAGTLDETWRRYAEYVARTVGLLSVTWIGPDEERTLHRSDEYLADALVALDWLIDHHEWNLAARIVGSTLDDRTADELAARLNDALIASGDHPPEASVIARSDLRRFQTSTSAELAQLGWEALRAGESVPDDWFARPTVVDVNPATPAQAEETFRALTRYVNGPAAVRALTCWSVLRSTLERGFGPSTIEGYAAARSRLEELAEQSGSNYVEGLILEIRAFEARYAGQYADAAQHFTAAATHDISWRRRGWWYLINTWNSVIARVMSGGSVDLVDVADAWAVQREERQEILNFRGALATGMALDAVGERMLAARFIVWMRDNAPHGFSDFFPRELDRFGDRVVVQPHDDENLDVLLADLQRITTGRATLADHL